MRRANKESKRVLGLGRASNETVAQWQYRTLIQADLHRFDSLTLSEGIAGTLYFTAQDWIAGGKLFRAYIFLYNAIFSIVGVAGIFYVPFYVTEHHKAGQNSTIWYGISVLIVIVCILGELYLISRLRWMLRNKSSPRTRKLEF